MAEESVDNARLWAQCLAHLSNNAEVNDRARAYLTLSQLAGFFGDVALILVPSPYVKDLVENKIPEPVKEALTAVRGKPTTFALTIDESVLEDEPITPAKVATTSSELATESKPEIPTSVDNDVDDVNKTVHFVRENEQERPSAAPIKRDEPDTGARHISGSGSENRETSAAKPATPSTGSFMANAEGLDRTRLNDKYTFDTFVVGSSNRFAQAAAYAVAEQPARAYNPLFIYGGSGLGKTHLLHAAGHYARQLDPSLEVRYVNSEEFTNDFINSVQAGQYKAQEFHRRYRDIDILLIDDIQFLQRAPETMEAFFHTFNTLHNANKQIMITSDLPPKQLDGFEDRMRSRFEMGLMVDVQPPDLETRIAILRKKVEMDDNQEVPHDVLEYIASNISTNIRELEGALTRVQALHSLSRQKMDVSLAESVLKDFLSNDGDSEITATAIIVQTANYFNISVEDIRGTTRTRALVNARQIAMYLCRELTDMPLTKIGEEFGGRDHTTVMHAEKKITKLMKERHSLFNQVTELTQRIKASVAAQ